MPLSTPVAFFIFNRPDTTARVFERIREARPARLLVVADGPRADRPGEAERCAETRAVSERVDWDCEVLRDYAPRNMGCKARVASGISWVFEQVPEAIILEDDCLPDPSFFRFCSELLERYREDPRVMAVNGNSFLPAPALEDNAYAFSRFTRIWGWASWRRAWRLYDLEMRGWDDFVRSGAPERIFPEAVRERMLEEFDGARNGRINTWDYQWLFCVLNNNGLCVRPPVNLARNLGYGAEGTHTTGRHPLGSYPAGAVRFPLHAPGRVEPDEELDRRELLYLERLSPREGWQRFLPRTGIVRKLKSFLSSGG